MCLIVQQEEPSGEGTRRVLPQREALHAVHRARTLLQKIQTVEIEAIKISFRLPPWASNTWCYSLVNFEKIKTRLQKLSKSFVEKNQDEELIKPLIEDIKPSMTGLHSPMYKVIKF